MATTDKDIGIKRKAVQFCLAQQMLPFLEIPVVEKTQLEATPSLSTDLDVLGLNFNWSGQVRRTLFDCKTSKDSPVNRAFWAAGLAAHLGLDEAYIILKRAAGPTHKLTAERRNVYLFDESGFDQFASFYGSDLTYFSSYLTDFSTQENIQKFFNERNPLWNLYIEASKLVSIELDASMGVRRLLRLLRDCRGELDPSKAGHVYLFLEVVSALSIYMFDIITKLVRLIGAHPDRRQLEDVIKYLLWGGKAEYENRQRIQQFVLRDLVEEASLFPAWDEFIRLNGIILAGVPSIARVPVAARTLGYKMISGHKTEYEADLKRLFQADPRMRQSVMLISRYARAASELPKDFLVVIEQQLASVVSSD